MIDVLVTGAAGRMGSLSAATIAAQADMRVVALVDPKGDARAAEAPAFKAVEEALALTSPTAALEFSVPGAVFANAKALLEAGVPTVVGATGLSDEQAGELAAAAAAANAGLVIAPNFALGAVLAMRFAAEAARYYEHAEVIELHEAGKLDAPSGTSLRTAQLMDGAGSALRAPAAGPASRGLQAGKVTIHSVRLPGLVAHQEVLFGGDDELLTIRHDSFSRRSFMAGVLLALRRVGDLHDTVVGLEHLL
jgi:4-hydroxy-tetrahydrodipicolinate reductase